MIIVRSRDPKQLANENSDIPGDVFEPTQIKINRIYQTVP